MYHTRASDDVDRLRRRAHRAAAGRAEINLRSVTWPFPISVIYRRETSLPPVMRRFVEIIKATAKTMAVGNLG
jgi:DNA-binding transcriptional LysR family regulator